MDGTPLMGSNQTTIGRWSVDRYVDITRPLTLVAMVTVFSVTRWLTINWIGLAIEALACLLIGWWTLKHDGQPLEGLTAGILTGLAVGFSAALAKLTLAFTFINFMNLVSETMLTGLVGGLLAVCVVLIRRQFIR